MRRKSMKNKFVKRLFSVMAVTAMTVSLLAGCGSPEKSEDKAASGEEAADRKSVV